MKFRLRVKTSKRSWKMGIRVYNSIEEAKNRKEELKAVNITSVIVDELGNKL